MGLASFNHARRLKAEQEAKDKAVRDAEAQEKETATKETSKPRRKRGE